MGWSEVKLMQNASQMTTEEIMRFYFVHSYHMVPEQQADVFMTSEFGNGFTAAIKRGNITGVQFHPEKSHAFGVAFLKYWLSAS